LPDNAPPEYTNRVTLWNAVEKIETAKNSQLAREIEIALPVELSREQNISLVRDYVKKNFVQHGMCADVCVHDTGTGNPHAHILLTIRPLDKDGTWGAKAQKEYLLNKQGERIRLASGEYRSRKVYTVDWNNPNKAEQWRSSWADAVNLTLERQNLSDRVDHRSFERQGVERIPTIHIGASASQMERKGISTDRGDINREVESLNSQLQQLGVQLSELQTWLSEEMENKTSPTLADVVADALTRRYGSIHNHKSSAHVLDFLTTNNIQDMAGLHEKFKSLVYEQVGIEQKLKPINNRLRTLDEHLRQYENYQNYRQHGAEYNKLYAEYEAIKNAKGWGWKGKSQKALDAAGEYRSKHYNKIIRYEDAAGYLKQYQSNGKLPLSAWKAERTNLAAEWRIVNQEYEQLKADVVDVTRIRSSVYDLTSAERRRRDQPQRSMELER